MMEVAGMAQAKRNTGSPTLKIPIYQMLRRTT
jgi:hypothetical protein